jgi:hypothetical protein
MSTEQTPTWPCPVHGSAYGMDGVCQKCTVTALRAEVARLRAELAHEIDMGMQAQVTRDTAVREAEERGFRAAMAARRASDEDGNAKWVFREGAFGRDKATVDVALAAWCQTQEEGQ